MTKDNASKKARRKAILENQEILAAELTYIGQTAFQTNEDRQRVAQFFFISFGSFIAAILSLQIEDETLAQQDIFFILGFVFLFVTFFGLSTLLQLTRLRNAWRDSAQAMNELKKYIRHAYEPGLNDAFAWLTTPPAFKPGSVGYYQALQVSSGTGTAFGTSVAFFLLALPVPLSFWLVVLIGIGLSLIGAFLSFERFYKRRLNG